MKIKIKNIFILCLLGFATVFLFTVSFTFGRYAEERDSEGLYSGDLEYIISNQVEIQSVDEFFTAIENGYNNIKIKDEVDNPLIISGGISDLNSDLIIDLNGHEVQRNNREPLLNVTQGVRLTIVDTSESQSGSFYNPVGSVLRISGGSLTVSAGIFESGPRSGEEGAPQSEYYGSGINGSATEQGAEIETGYTVNTMYVNGTQAVEGVSLPVIIPAVKSLANDNYSVNGNIYFPYRYENSSEIPADTYMYFTLDDDTVENATAVVEGSADYYYCYYLEKAADGTYYYDNDVQQQTDSNVLITVYVYKNDKGAAEIQGNSYAAVEMAGGNLYVRGGTFRSYFGVDNTYCVNASGGYMAIEAGDFYAYGNGVCVECAYESGTDTEEEYLRVSNGDFYSEIGNTIGVSGGRMVVSNAGFVKNTLDYAMDGAARNANGSAIHVSGGSLSVSSASQIYFSLYGSGMSGITAEGSNASVSVKNVEMDFYSGTDGSVDFTSPTGISYNTGIYAAGGTVLCDGNSVFNVIGAYSSGIYSNGGQININGEKFVCDIKTDKSNANAKVLSSTAISAVGGNIFFNVGRAEISSDGLGITVGGGDITFSHASQETINITTSRGTAIYVYDGSISVDENSTVNVVSTIESDCTWATDTSGGSSGGTGTGVNVNNGIYINGGSLVSEGMITVRHTGVANSGASDSMVKSYAVRVDGQLSSDSSKFDAKEVNITVVDNGGGLYVNQGSISIGTADIDTPGYGIAMRGASDDKVTIKNSLTLESKYATGIYITGGSLELNENSTANVTSTVDSNYVFCTPVSSVSTVSYDGVYVYGGSLFANGTFNVTHHGLANDYQTGNGNELYRTFEYKSFAVRIDGENSSDSTNVVIRKGNINNDSGGGVYVNGGSVTLGREGGEVSDITITTSGDDLFNTGYVDFSSTAAGNWDYRVTSTGGPALNVSGGSLTVYNGTYSASQGNGIVVKNGTANIFGGNFNGSDVYEASLASGGGKLAGPAASYGFAVFGGTANVYDGTFNEGSQGSGAFVTGVYGQSATANIYGGTFEVSGQAGFSIYEYATVLFSPRGGENGLGSDILVKGDAAGLTIETNNTEGVNVTINGGRFESVRTTNGDGIWCGDDRTVLTITGGEFVGSSRSGLRLDQNGADTLIVKLSGGSFVYGISTNNGYNYNLLETGYTYSYSGNTTQVVPI